METFEIHTNWTNTVHEVHRISLEELREARYRVLLKAVFRDPDRLKPGQTRQALTEQAAREFAGLALRLREGAMNRSVWRTSSTGSSSACSRRMWACYPAKCFSGCSSKA